MNPFWWLFGFSGRIGRLSYLVGVLLVCGLSYLAVVQALAALPAMAEVLAPQGINAAFALNTIWLTSGALALWSICALSAKRLCDRGHWPGWGALALVPLAGLALLNDAVFLASRSVQLPQPLQLAILSACTIVLAGVLFECVLMPGRKAER